MSDSTERGRRPVTAHDVARLAGVSQSAVSRTFTKGASVSPDTRRKVEEAAASLGYRPNLVARSLITRRSNLIGVAIPGMANPFYARVLEALSAEFEQLGYRILLFSMANNEDSDPVLEEILRYQVDGLVLVSASLSSRFAEECRTIGLPVVLFNRTNDSTSVSSVTSDNLTGSRTIAEFLLAGGHERLAFIAGKQSSSTNRDREAGFNGYLQEQGRPLALREVGDYTFDGAVAATRRLLSLDSPPDAIFCANDLMALAAINVCHELRVQPGKDVSIVGFDDLPQGQWPVFGLTTFEQPLAEMIGRAVNIVCAQLANPETPAIQEVLPGRMIVRGTARVPATGIIDVDGERIWRP
ncbi:LacI family DNA-binding transcriptional regulator [Pseudomonas abietaniphila]|jgi:DNA-binding LacI/PurR family transcriptional regulator